MQETFSCVFQVFLDKVGSHEYNILCRQDKAYVRVAQLDRASGYGPEGRGFESCHAH